jgi:hypothetical protein
MSKETYSVVEISACNISTSSVIVVGPVAIDNLRYFSVACISCATQAVNYQIQLSPYYGEGFATAGANFTATSIAQASGADLVVSNKVSDNHHAWLRIQASAAGLSPKGDVRFVIHGVRF